MNGNSPVCPPIFIVSGGKGLAAYTMIQSLLVQYPNNKVAVRVFPNFQVPEQIPGLIEQAKKANALIAHTLVCADLRAALHAACEKEHIREIDYMGPLAGYLEDELGLRSVNQPGLFRKINAPYYERIDAMEFTLNHDDGMNPERMHEADIILTGVSRAGKTPLSVYMSMFGWKVANVPLVFGIDPPRQLFEVDRQRVFALKISSTFLIPHRAKRMKNFRQSENTDYTDLRMVNREIAYADSIFEKGGFTVINVVNKPIETSANEIAALMSERFGFDRQRNNPIER